MFRTRVLSRSKGSTFYGTPASLAGDTTLATRTTDLPISRALVGERKQNGGYNIHYWQDQGV